MTRLEPARVVSFTNSKYGEAASGQNVIPVFQNEIIVAAVQSRSR